MKTLKLTENELVTIKVALFSHMQQMRKDIEQAKRQGKDTSFQEQALQEAQQAFEALSFAQ
jgi:low affinity Fe/Cu permease